jgi:hypothetical protein
VTTQRRVNAWSMVGDFVVQNLLICWIEPNPLFYNRLPVSMEWNSAGLEGAGTFQESRLDLQLIIHTVTVGIYPFADRVAHERTIGAVRENTAICMNATNP